MMKNWYAVYTKPQQEQKVMAALLKKGIEAYCPITRVSSYRGFGARINWQPLLSPLVFVHIDPSQLETVRQVNDVINFMYWLGAPALVPANEIKSIRQFAGTYQKLKVEKTAVVKNAVATVLNEPFQHFYKGVSGIQKFRIKLTLPSLGFILVAETTKPAGMFQFDFEIKEMISHLQLN